MYFQAETGVCTLRPASNQYLILYPMFGELKLEKKEQSVADLILITNVNPKKFSFSPLFAESNSNLSSRA